MPSGPTVKRHQTQWASQFAVASELCKRGYEVSFTMGNNTPLADMMVTSPKNREMFLVDVKGLAYENYWQIKRQPSRSGLFYVLALVPRERENRFFILTQDEINANIIIEFDRLPDEKKKLGEVANRLGMRWKDSLKFENRWEVLPQ